MGLSSSFVSVPAGVLRTRGAWTAFFLINFFIVYGLTNLKFIIYFWDAYFPFNPDAMFIRSSFTWIDFNSGAYNPGWSTFVTVTIPYVLLHDIFGLNLSASQSIMLFIFLNLQSIGTYEFMNKFLIIRGFTQTGKIKLASFCAACVYTYNLLMMLYPLEYTQFYYLTLSLPLIGLALVHLFRSLENNSHYLVGFYSIVIYFLLYLAALASPKVWFSLPLVLTFLVVAIGRRKRLKYILILCCLLILATSSLWFSLGIGGFVQKTAFTYVREKDLYKSIITIRTSPATPLGVFDLAGNIMLQEPVYSEHKFFEQTYPFTSFLKVCALGASLLAFSGVLSKRLFGREKRIYVFGIILFSLLTIVNTPLSALFWYLYNIYPALLVPLDDPWVVWGPLYMLVLSIIIGLTVVYIMLTRRLSILKLATLGIVLLFSIFNLTVMVTGAYVPSGYWNARVEIPSYYYQAANYLSRDSHSMVAVFPLPESLTSSTWERPYVGSEILSYLLVNPTIGSAIDTISNPLINLLSNLTDSGSFTPAGKLNNLLVLDNSTEIVIPRVLFHNNAHYGFLQSDYKFLVRASSQYNVTFVGRPVGHVDVIVYTKNGTSFANVAYSNRSSYSFVLNASGGDTIEPRVWSGTSSNVSSIIIMASDSGARPKYLGFQIINALRYLGVKYVIVRSDVRYYPEIPHAQANSSFLNAFFSVHLGKPVGFGNLSIYTINETLPRIFSPARLSVINNNDSVLVLSKAFEAYSAFVQDFNSTLVNTLSNLNVSWTQISSVEYSVSGSSNKPFVLILNQNYNEYWAVIAEQGKVKVLEHFLANGFANGWLIESSGNFSVKIYYVVQNWVYTVTLASMAFPVGILCVILFEKFYSGVYARHRRTTSV